jgi:transmembrane sensor
MIMALSSEEYSRIANFLSGQMTAEERVTIENWRKTKPENEQDFQEAKLIWENSVRLTDDEINTEQEWRALLSLLQKGQNAKVVSINRGTPTRLIKIAASILVLFLIGLWFIKTNFVADPANPETFTFNAGQNVETFYLPDSTMVWLNSNSTLTYTSVFGETERRILFQGEGYFNVTPNKQKPFIIETNQAFVQVIGTSFNLKEEQQAVTVTVAEGVVKFSPADTATHKGILVMPNEMALLTADKGVTKTENNNPAYGAWRTKNNPAFDQEKHEPSKFITHAFTWKKNAINQSVISGELKSSAGLASYKNLVLRVTYTKASGKTATTRISVVGPLSPGSLIKFEKRLLDIFSDTQTMELTIESAEAIPPY